MNEIRVPTPRRRIAGFTHILRQVQDLLGFTSTKIRSRVLAIGTPQKSGTLKTLPRHPQKYRRRPFLVLKRLTVTRYVETFFPPKCSSFCGNIAGARSGPYKSNPSKLRWRFFGTTGMETKREWV